ncbi:TonB-dependent hemoglobin/transferrin/lactoferrin family receptor [Ralstonia solanacearum]|nr:TonB-dependent hemoglobin/transferrin/lactoferrin family receptor [Ralstonia solanacearum]
MTAEPDKSAFPKVWNWSDVAGLGLAGSTALDAYTAPGRTFAATVKIEF